MAQNLVCFASSDEENANTSPLPVKPNSSSSSDSDSDSAIPKIKKKRSTQTFNSAKNSGTEIKQSSSLFGGTSSIFSCGQSIYTAQTSQLSAGRALVVGTKDEEEDEEDVFKKKTKKTRQRKTSESKSTDKRTIKGKRTSPRKDENKQSAEVVEDYKPQVIMLEDESTDVDSDLTEDDKQDTSELSLSQTREPTPPPSPSEESLPAGHNNKMKKKVKKAFKKLEQAKLVHEKMADYSLNDPELSFIDLESPVKSDDVSVKVKSRSGIQRFSVKKSDTFTQIFREMAAHESVKESQLSMFFNERKVTLYDTPTTLSLGVADIIECFIKRSDDIVEEDSILDDPDTIALRVQTKDAKSRLNIKISMDEPLERLMREFCERKSLDYDNVTYQFDGEDIYSYQTPSMLDLEDGYCIDVII